MYLIFVGQNALQLIIASSIPKQKLSKTSICTRNELKVQFVPRKRYKPKERLKIYAYFM
jgi:hypothetical protein